MMETGIQMFTLAILATPPGAAFFTYLFVLYTRRLVDKWAWSQYIGTDLYSVLVGFITLAIGQIGVGASPLDWKVWVLAFANGFIVALISGKMNDKAVNESMRLTKQEK